MVHFGDLEAWFVTGSQHLYGPDVLKTVQQHAETIAKALAASPEIPVKILPKPVMTGSESIHQLCLEANSSGQMCRADRMDAHLFPRPHVDRRPSITQPASASSAHAIQSGIALVHHRYGLHESEPIRSWRSGVRLHRGPHAFETENRCRLLAGC